MPKNIIIFSDGTGQEGGIGHHSNIYKLYKLVVNRHPQQIAYYSQGLGTGLHKVSGNISGMGISKNIINCYRFIFDHYQVGDKIYLFGFSRGAATMRSLANFIHHFGILPKARPELINQAYRLYKNTAQKNINKKAKAFVDRHHNIWAHIHFLGCFDTVAALGLPNKTLSGLLNKIPFFKHEFQDFTLSESVINAYHALAIDDKREAFQPLLWQKKSNKRQNIKQVWFCGMHTDIGGGYKESGLSDIPLQWMLGNAEQHGLLVFKDHQVAIKPNAHDTMHNSMAGIWNIIYKEKPRCGLSKTQPVIHESVIKRSQMPKYLGEPKYTPWILKCDHNIEKDSTKLIKKGLSRKTSGIKKQIKE